MVAGISSNQSAQPENKTEDLKDIFYEKSEEVSDQFCKYDLKTPMPNQGEKTISNKLLGMQVYMKIVKTMVFGQ